MSTTSSDRRVRSERHDSFEAMPPTEQLRGMLILILVLLLAILLQSL